MVNLYIKTKDQGRHQINGVLFLNTQGCLEASADSNNKISIKVNRPDQSTWAASYKEGKLSAIENSGSYYEGFMSPNNYLFPRSIKEIVAENVVTSLNGVYPTDKGKLILLPSSTVNVDGLTATPCTVSKYNYTEIAYMMWRIYQELKLLEYRLLVYNPKANTCNYPDETLYEYPALGTYPNYEALVDRWNLLAYASQFVADIDSESCCMAISVGMSNASCKNSGTYRIETKIYLSNVQKTECFTIYKSSVKKAGTTENSCIMKRGNEVVSGKGTLEEAEADRNAWTTGSIDINITSTESFGYYQALFNVAPISIAVKKNDNNEVTRSSALVDLKPIDGGSALVEITWYKDNTVLYKKSFTKTLSGLTNINFVEENE